MNMKPFVPLAAFLLCLHVSQGQPDGSSPTGVHEPLAVLNAERAWADAGVLLGVSGVHEPLAVLNAERAWADAGVLLGIHQESDESRNATVRALGRIEDPTLIPRVIALDASTRATASAIAQSLHGFDPSRDPDL